MERELKAKTVWIRDELEPYVARNGPRHLSPDTVLDINTFLLSLGQMLPHLTLEAVLHSRVHKALLLISGRGTRWPGKLIEVSDALIAEMTARFGNLDLLRPQLYEKGGRLEAFADERHLGRHVGESMCKDSFEQQLNTTKGLIMNWLSDPSSMVSPLNAHEYGHLGFKPGQWWVHPVFAFHDGIIDSPDPLGGITADADGAYAIVLTNSDESSFNSAEYFTYRCHTKDKGKHRLMNAILPPKQSIRVLRSHTLRSPHAPAAGLRYEGLYKIMSYGMHMVKNQIAWDITLRRDIDQVSMREVELHPTANEVDDYVEYKRLRELRQGVYQEQPSSSIKPASRTTTPLFPEKPQARHLPPGVNAELMSTDASGVLRHTPLHFNPQGPSTPASIRDYQFGQEIGTPTPSSTMFIGGIDGALGLEVDSGHGSTLNLLEECSAHSATPNVDVATETSLRKDSAWSDDSKMNEPLLKNQHDFRRQSMTEQCTRVEHLANKLGDLQVVTMHKGQCSRQFSADLEHFAKRVHQLRLETQKMAKALPAASNATDVQDEIELEYLQHCLKDLEQDLKVASELVASAPSREVTASELADGHAKPVDGHSDADADVQPTDAKEADVDSDDDAGTEALQKFRVRYSIDGVLASEERELPPDEDAEP